MATTIHRVEPRGVIEGSDDSLSITYHIETDTTNNIVAILNDSSVPQPGEVYVYDNTYILQSGRQLRSLTRDRNQWEMDVVAKKRAAVAQLMGDKDRLVSYRFGVQRYQEVMDYAFRKQSDGTWTAEREPVMNSADDFFDPMPMTVRMNPTIVWEQREPDSVQPLNILGQTETINKAQVTILGITIPAEKAQLTQATPRWAGDEYITRYQVEIEQGHRLTSKIVDQGYRKLNDNDNQVYIKKGELDEDEPDDEEVDDPVHLDGSGGIHPQAKKGGSMPILPDDKYYRVYRDPELSDWNTVLDLIEDAP